MGSAEQYWVSQRLSINIDVWPYINNSLSQMISHNQILVNTDYFSHSFIYKAGKKSIKMKIKF